MEQSGNNEGIIEKTPAKKRKRLPSQERLRRELLHQLRDSLVKSQEKMKNQELTLAEQEHWTRVHTYTAQVLNTILRDQQFREWERRLKELERQGLIPVGSLTNREP
jgi:hypothetical protein